MSYAERFIVCGAKDNTVASTIMIHIANLAQHNKVWVKNNAIIQMQNKILAIHILVVSA